MRIVDKSLTTLCRTEYMPRVPEKNDKIGRTKTQKKINPAVFSASKGHE